MLAPLLLLAGSAPTWTLALGGDIMLNSVPAGSKPLAQISSAFRSADVAYANLEIPLTDRTARTERKTAAELKAKTQFVLKASPLHGAHLRDTGIDLVSLGNNHALDYRLAGLQQMMRTLDRAGVLYAGAGLDATDAESVAVYRTRGGTRVGMISYLAFVGERSLWRNTPATATAPGVAALFAGGKVSDAVRARLRTAVTKARGKCDFLIAALHWGIERQPLPTSYQVSLGRAFVDAGVDLVAGAHPHVLQGGELYRGKPIFYSLGNLISPRPGDSGVFVLSFDGRRLVNVVMEPHRISGGKARTVKDAKARVRAFDSLCDSMRRRFANGASRELPLSGH